MRGTHDQQLTILSMKLRRVHIRGMIFYTNLFRLFPEYLMVVLRILSLVFTKFV